MENDLRRRGVRNWSQKTRTEWHTLCSGDQGQTTERPTGSLNWLLYYGIKHTHTYKKKL